MSKDGPDSKREYTVIYDGDCKVCRRSVAALDKWDTRKRLELVRSQSPEVASRFPWIPPRAFDDSIQVVRSSDNTTWQGAAAVEQLFNVVPRGNRVSWLFAIPFARGIADKLYRWFARRRHRFGCSDHCAAP